MTDEEIHNLEEEIKLQIYSRLIANRKKPIRDYNQSTFKRDLYSWVCESYFEKYSKQINPNAFILLIQSYILKNYICFNDEPDGNYYNERVRRYSTGFPETIIFSEDGIEFFAPTNDDNIYHRNYVQHMIKHYIKNDDEVLLKLLDSYKRNFLDENFISMILTARAIIERIIRNTVHFIISKAILGSKEHETLKKYNKSTCNLSNVFNELEKTFSLLINSFYDSKKNSKGDLESSLKKDYNLKIKTLNSFRNCFEVLNENGNLANHNSSQLENISREKANQIQEFFLRFFYNFAILKEFIK